MRTSFALILEHLLKDMIQRWPLIVDRMAFLSFHNNQTLKQRWLYQSSPFLWMAMITLGTYLMLPTESPCCITLDQRTACASPSSCRAHFPPHCACSDSGYCREGIQPQAAVGIVYSITPHLQTWVGDKPDKRLRPKVSRHPVQPLKMSAFSRWAWLPFLRDQESCLVVNVFSYHTEKEKKK